jgi:hypothetical protein
MSAWNPNAASLVVDLRHLRCSQCKVRVDDRFAERCPTCGAVFDRVVSSHVGLAQRLIQERRSHFAATSKPVSQPDAIAPDAGSRQRELASA